MVRDLILDMAEHDLSFHDKSNSAMPMFDTVWGNLFDEDESVDVTICNVIIPEAFHESVAFTDGELLLKFTSSYQPIDRPFNIRLIALINNSYSLFQGVQNDYGTPVKSYALNPNMAESINASLLPFINMDGQYLVRLIKSESDTEVRAAYIYSSAESDIMVGFSDSQASQLLSLNAPGKLYRYPTTGVGITTYLNCVVDHSNLLENMQTQFEADNKAIRMVEFDNTTGQLDVMATPEQEQQDTDLEDIENLSVDLFSIFTDEYIRHNQVLSEVDNSTFIDELNKYSQLINIVFFEDSLTSISRISNRVDSGRLNALGEIMPDKDYYVVSASLEPNTIIMVDDKNADALSDSPLFVINGENNTPLYISLIEQPYWISEQCHKCFILRHRATVKYAIKKVDYAAGRGLFIVPQVSNNVKNMIAIAQDDITGGLMAIVSDNTTINDVTLDEVTQHIYASQNSL